MDISLIDLPPERLEQVCSNLDTPSLINAMESHSKIYQSCKYVILDRLKQYILNYIVSNFSEHEFKRGLRLREESGYDEVLGFKSYKQLIDFQKKYLDLLDENRLRTIVLLIQELLRGVKMMDMENMEDFNVGGIVFNKIGKMVI